MTGKTRAEIPVECVNLYVQPPPSYETIGMVKASSTTDAAPRVQVMSLVVPELKRQAAKMGANGVVLLKMECPTRSYLEESVRAFLGGFLTGGLLHFETQAWPVKATAIFERHYKVFPRCAPRGVQVGGG